METRKDDSTMLGLMILLLGLAFRGNNEYEHSSNHGNFIELLQFLADHNEDVTAITLKNTPANHKLTSPDIQKDIITACATETIKAIIKDIGTSWFSVLIYESYDVSTKEHMTIILRYVDKNGHVVERFIGIEHVTSTIALSLKATIDEVFSRHKLSMSRLRGQGYDGASNMQGEFNGLKALIMKESGCAYYIHCFAYQLQLALADVTKKNIQIESLFSIVTILVNVVDKNGHVVERFIGIEHVTSTVALSLKATIDEVFFRHKLSMSRLRGIVTILVNVVGASSKRCDILREKQSIAVIEALNSGITNEVSQALQRKDHDIVNAMQLVGVSDSFSAFDSQKLVRFAQFYLRDFSINELVILKIQFETYVVDMRSNIEFSSLKEIGDLAKKMVQCKKHKVYSLVYL
ncbi:unnamed protein product [Malus baccata var. baccata]